MPELLGFKSQDISKSYKQLVTLCNSLAVVFLQYELYEHAGFMLATALRAEDNLTRHGTATDRAWKGNVCVFNNHAMYHYK